MIRIGIAEDNKFFTEALETLIGLMENVQVVYKSSNGLAFLENPSFKDIDLALVDINMPVLDGLNATKLAKQQRPELQIVAVSGVSSRYMKQRMIEAGASDFINKDQITKPLLVSMFNRIINTRILRGRP